MVFESPELFALARRICSRKIYPRGSVIWASGDPAKTIYFLVRGQISISAEVTRKTTIDLVNAGEIFGLLSLTASGRRSAHCTAIAEVRSEVLEISCSDFIAHVRNRSDLLLQLLTVVAERLIFTQEHAAVLAQHRADRRVCALLLYLARSRGHADPGDPGRVRIPFTHTELANMASLTRSRLSVIMSGLRRDGIVQYGRSTRPKVNTAAASSRLRRS